MRRANGRRRIEPRKGSSVFEKPFQSSSGTQSNSNRIRSSWGQSFFLAFLANLVSNHFLTHLGIFFVLIWSAWQTIISKAIVFIKSPFLGQRDFSRRPFRLSCYQSPSKLPTISVGACLVSSGLPSNKLTVNVLSSLPESRVV